MAKNKPNKSDFIRSQPKEMPAAQVVAKAKEAGMSITPGLVYAVRAGSKKKGKSPAAAPAAAKAAKSGGTGGSASDFIRAQPASKTARQVAEEAHKHGFKFKAAYVYTVRRAHEKRGGAPANKRRGRPPNVAKAHAGPAKPASKAEHASVRHTLLNLMMRVGLDSFEGLYSDILRDFKAIAASK